jgi:hypothetical protein
MGASLIICKRGACSVLLILRLEWGMVSPDIPAIGRVVRMEKSVSGKGSAHPVYTISGRKALATKGVC